MLPVNYRLKLPTQWSIHDIFHINLLTPYHETMIHGPNYSRPPPDLIDNQEEYEVEKILDSRWYGRRCTLQYLVKWKGYPNSDNKWINQKDVHAPEKIREFKKLNSTTETHISAGITGKYCILPFQTHYPSLKSSPMSHDDVNAYYLGSPECIFGAELDSQLITCEEAQELCIKKYLHPHVTDENELTAPLTKGELAQVRDMFPEVAM